MLTGGKFRPLEDPNQTRDRLAFPSSENNRPLPYLPFPLLRTDTTVLGSLQNLFALEVPTTTTKPLQRSSIPGCCWSLLLGLFGVHMECMDRGWK